MFNQPIALIVVIVCGRPSEMDDNLRNETHHRLRRPSCMGLKRAYDALVIEIDSKTCSSLKWVQ